VRGVIVNQASEDFSHHLAVQSLGDWLKKHNIPALTGVDTRALTKKLREHGVMLGRIVQDDSPSTADIVDPNVNNLVAEVSCNKLFKYTKSLIYPLMLSYILKKILTSTTY
jgi:carbamoylphosphate synthase small subunit